MLSKRSPEFALSANDWLQSPNLARIARVIARRMGLPAQDFDDFFQDLRIRLWRVGPSTRVNTSWVFQTAAHLALDLNRQSERLKLLRRPRAAAETPHVELLALLHARVALLPAESRAVYELHLRGLSEREIARRLEMDRAKVRRVNEWNLRFFGARRVVATSLRGPPLRERYSNGFPKTSGRGKGSRRLPKRGPGLSF